MAKKKPTETPWLDVDELNLAFRQRENFERLLKHLGLWESLEIKDSQARMVAPWRPEERQKHLSLHLDRGLWQDFGWTEGKHPPGNPAGLVHLLLSQREGFTFRQALDLMQELLSEGGTPVEPTADTTPDAEPAQVPLVNTPWKKTLSVRTSGLPYFEKLGIGESVLKQLGIGFYSGPGLLRNYVVYPVRNHLKKVLFYFGEAVRVNQTPQTKFPPGTHPSIELHNLDRILHDELSQERTRIHGLLVVPHPNDVAKLIQEGWPNCVSLMGFAQMSDIQAQLVTQYDNNPSGKVQLLMPPTEKGIWGRKESLRRLIHLGYGRYGNHHYWPEGKTRVAELSGEELEAVIGLSPYLPEHP